MLAMHPDVAWFSQFSQRDGKIPGRFKLPFYKFANRILRSYLTHDWRKKEEPLLDYLVPRPREINKIWDYIIHPLYASLTEETSSNEFIHRLRSVFSNECSAWRKNIIIIKFIKLARHINLLHSAFPKAIFVHIVRDGRAVPPTTLHKVLSRSDDSSQIGALQKAARNWKEVVGNIHKHKEEGNINLFEIRYEDFCTSPRRHISQLLSFANLDVRSFPFKKCPDKLIVTNPKEFNRLTNEEIVMLEQMLGKWLTMYGYQIPLKDTTLVNKQELA